MNEMFYRDFEDRFRGSRELITERLRVYEPFIKPYLQILDKPIVLDLGCGRCEWLELVSSWGCSAIGVDQDSGMLSACNGISAELHQADALTFIKQQADESIAVISSFHVVEHLDFKYLHALVEESLRVLIPGGILIMETPNPDNIIVASRNFYLDPTHKNPLPSELLAFLPEQIGFSRVKILLLQEDKRLYDTGSVSLLDVLGRVSPDYSVVAQKFSKKNVSQQWDEAFSKEYGLSLGTLLERYTKEQASVKDKVTIEGERVQQLAVRLDQMLPRLAEVDLHLAQARSKHQSEFEALECLMHDDLHLYSSRVMQVEARVASGEERIARVDDSLSVFRQHNDTLKVRLERLASDHQNSRQELVDLRNDFLGVQSTVQAVEQVVTESRTGLEQVQGLIQGQQDALQSMRNETATLQQKLEALEITRIDDENRRAVVTRASKDLAAFFRQRLQECM